LAGLNLPQAGNRLRGDCPSGKHTSQSGRCFNVNIDKNYYHCFNCGIGGDVIDLVELVQNCTFTEALKWFKENYNLDFKIHESTAVRKEIENK
ncbi:CHC2 zinc finger domain-containing protein, partial [Dolichospermum sp. ST_sed4]|nr:CHC2 zinc finger domain-containing protein [Dolichospermum sp. ST_sed4]